MATAGCGCVDSMPSRAGRSTEATAPSRPFWSPDGRSDYVLHPQQAEANRRDRRAAAGHLRGGSGEGSGTSSREGVIVFGDSSDSHSIAWPGLAAFSYRNSPGCFAAAVQACRVSAGWAPLAASGAEQQSGRDGCVSGDPGVDRNTTGICRGIPRRPSRHARVGEPQQRTANRAARPTTPNACRSAL